MRGLRIAGIVLLAAVIGFAAAHWLWPERGDPAPAVAPAAPPTAGDPNAPEPRLLRPYDELRIASSETIAIEASALEPGRPLVLHLELGEPSRTDEPRPVRIISPDSQVIEGAGTLEGDRQQVRFEFDPAFLHPGRYIVEVRTTEMSHFPLRRYAIEVR